MNLIEAGIYCDNAWSQFAEKFGIRRDDEFYLFKLQEELGELSRAFLELRGSEKRHTDSMETLKKKFDEDVAVLIGNALILAKHFEVDVEKNIKEKFQV
jgi:NTP pyrophosphatase (non-canonical NTP hydrolase)